eukprot:4628308-Prymnesium_polylepis.1
MRRTVWPTPSSRTRARSLGRAAQLAVPTSWTRDPSGLRHGRHGQAVQGADAGAGCGGGRTG